MENKRVYLSSGIAARLRAARVKRNFSQSELSLRAGLDRKTCYNVETDKVGTVSLLTVEKLALALDVLPAWLAFGADDSQARIAGLLKELVAIKEERRALTAPPPDAFDDFKTDLDWDAEMTAKEEGIVLIEEPDQLIWPLGWRPLGVQYRALPPLGRQYRPILDAIGPALPLTRRKELAGALLVILRPGVNIMYKERARAIREVLLYMVPEPDHVVVDLVMKDLESGDDTTKGMMALKLIIDGGLPVSYARLMVARKECTSPTLKAALSTAIEIFENLFWTEREELAAGPQKRTLLPPPLVEYIPQVQEDARRQVEESEAASRQPA